MIDSTKIVSMVPQALRIAMRSPCAKSKRGVIIIYEQRSNRELVVRAVGFNGPPPGFRCDASPWCRKVCGMLCNHAETEALRDLMSTQMLPAEDLHMLHVKAVDGVAVASGPPSCWQCSREILASGVIHKMWLLHEDVLSGAIVPVAYSPDEFHEQTLQHCGLPVIR